ncbi:cytochrome c [Luteibacter jiangsuensis]|uniref:Cytochrome c n=1 Tax=Luteibacter jiangsuensis TaxID=637577 RepID=A0ABX0Q1D9_9GAMM|nr:cytochrome c [Luteibacter jiangsuensis]NID03571.1 cytochrome c [Luteibacter jiangsuensis]
MKKRWKRVLIALPVVLVIGAGAYAWLNRTDPADGKAPSLAGAPPSSDPVARGEYLTRAADCIACHVTPGGKPFAGGLAFKLPFGTIYSSNITPDPDTGIGRYTDEEFVRAVREGIRRDGKHLYPAFPYTSYTELSRADVLAIKAYLFTLPKVRQPNRENDIGFPFNQRWAMGFWNAAFFRSHRFEPDANRSEAWNRGAYLAGALAHCGECHTPRNIGFAMSKGSLLAGETVNGWRAWNITSDATHGIGAWPDAAVAQYLSTGHADGRGTAGGPMGEAVDHSLQYLDAADISALVTWLRTVPAKEGKDPVVVDAGAPGLRASNELLPGSDPSASDMGRQLFAGACASCHQWNGPGRQTPQAGLAGTRGVNDPSGANVVGIILEGVSMRVRDQDIYMPAFAQTFNDAEVAALANYVVHHFGGKAGTVTPAEVAKRRAE